MEFNITTSQLLQFGEFFYSRTLQKSYLCTRKFQNFQFIVLGLILKTLNYTFKTLNKLVCFDRTPTENCL